MSRSPAALRGRLLLGCALGAAAFATLPAAAQAVTVSEDGGTLTVREGSANEVNNVRLLAGPSGRVTISDQVALKLSTDDCRRLTPFELECGAQSAVSVDLGDGNDFFTSTAPVAIALQGGPGDDTYVGGLGTAVSRVAYAGGAGRDVASYGSATAGVVVSKDAAANDGRINVDRDNVATDVERVNGSQFTDLMAGGPAYEELWSPGPGDDTVLGNAGNDILLAGTQADGADTFRGGAGEFDTADYSQRTQFVELSPNFLGRNDGENGERDELDDIEILNGGAGGDLLRAASPTFAYLFGGPGNDLLQTSIGSNYMDGGAGRDNYQGGAGSDHIEAIDGIAERVDCNKGTDSARVDTREEFVFQCETRSDIGKLRLTPSQGAVAAGDAERLALTWEHPVSWKRLQSVTLTVRDGKGGPVAAVRIDPRRERVRVTGSGLGLKSGAAKLGHDGKAVTAVLRIRPDAALAGRTLVADVSATDRRGRVQHERGAATLRVR